MLQEVKLCMSASHFEIHGRKNLPKCMCNFNIQRIAVKVLTRSYSHYWPGVILINGDFFNLDEKFWKGVEAFTNNLREQCNSIGKSIVSYIVVSSLHNGYYGSHDWFSGVANLSHLLWQEVIETSLHTISESLDLVKLV